MGKTNCDNCINSGRPSYEYPCTVCETAYDSAPSKWESLVPAHADMVEVVRCKDCKHFVAPQGVPCCDNFYGLGFPNANGNDFCSYGERKDK